MENFIHTILLVIRLGEHGRIPSENVKYMDPRIKYDGLNWYITVGIDLGIKKLEKRKRRLQRSISRKYEKNRKGESYCKTSNIIKSEKELLRLTHRLTNIRQNYLRQTTTEIVKTKPFYIVLEDLIISL